MSHIPERQEKDCLNCGAIVQGHYCQNCGQENVVTRETFWHMFTHFFYDITHFDSSFFHTIHHLVLRPGFLSLEYMRGRRVSYLHPIRMYVFTSAIFFLLFFTFFSPKTNFVSPDAKVSPEQREVYIQTMHAALKKDTGNAMLKEKIRIAQDTSQQLLERDLYRLYSNSNFIQFGKINYTSIAQYDSAEAASPPSERDSWLGRRIMYRVIEINNKYRDNPQEAIKKLGHDVLHKLPYLLFVSLPLFALILRLVYIRRRKQFFFADHGVFTIHLYVFTFLHLLTIFLLTSLYELTKWSFIEPLVVLLFFALLFYLYMGMRKFYKQGWGKTFIKFLLVAFLSFLMMLVLFILFLLFSVVTL